ncbi:MAG: hypothetical protein E7546_01015 [Ruminococcaceae bacterium]|nr:hypothetical protein [Oscillospiraceae bacterium]
MKHTFKFKLFGSNVHMFSEEEMGIVVEKESHVVCVYATDEKHQNILCAIPLCHPKFLSGAEYTVDFCDNGQAKVCVADIQIIIDFSKKKCANNKSIKCYGSDCWGDDVQIEWNEANC